MTMGASRSISEIWSQRGVPVVYRSGEKGESLAVRLPYRSDNYEWLRGPRARKPKWEAGRKFWTVPTAWFDELVERAAIRYGAVYVIQPHRRMEKCAPACWNRGDPVFLLLPQPEPRRRPAKRQLVRDLRSPGRAMERPRVVLAVAQAEELVGSRCR
jgi:hypothetical protein